MATGGEVLLLPFTHNIDSQNIDAAFKKFSIRTLLFSKCTDVLSPVFKMENGFMNCKENGCTW